MKKWIFQMYGCQKRTSIKEVKCPKCSDIEVFREMENSWRVYAITADI